MNINTNINALATELARASKHASNARTAYDAALALSKRSKSRAVLLATVEPLYVAARDANEAASLAFNGARADDCVAADLLSLENGIEQCLQGATVSLNVDFHQVASLIQVGAGYRKSIESSDWKALRNIRLSGIWDSVSVEINTGHNGQVLNFDVGFDACYTDREGKHLIRRRGVRIDIECQHVRAFGRRRLPRGSSLPPFKGWSFSTVEV
jgi:hypothetical protein